MEEPPPRSVLQQRPLPWGRQHSQGLRPVPAVLPKPQRRKRELPEEESSKPSLKRQKTLRVELAAPLEVPTPHVPVHCLYAYANIPVVSIMPQHCYPSTIVNHLQSMGIAPIAQTLAERAVLPAGRLTHCMENWRRVTQDQWVLKAIRGYRIPFVSEPPRQTQLPRQ